MKKTFKWKMRPFIVHTSVWVEYISVSFCIFFIFKEKHMVVCACVLMWICPNCNAIVWMCVQGERKWPGPALFFILNTLLSLLEPCLAVILKKVNLEQMVVAAHGLFFFCFSLFLWYFSSFFCVRVQRLLLFCGMDNINERDSRERQKKYTTYITLCYEQNINL